MSKPGFNLPRRVNKLLRELEFFPTPNKDDFHTHAHGSAHGFRLDVGRGYFEKKGFSFALSDGRTNRWTYRPAPDAPEHELTDWLRTHGYPVDDILRPKRLAALLAL